MLPIEQTVARFWSYVDASGGPEACWEWTGDRSKQGYGIFYADNRRHYAHRWLLGYLRGRPLSRQPVGVEDACHRCDNPPCCNPAHLYIGSRKRNIADAVERSRIWQLRKTHCPQGHPYDGDNLELRKSGARRCRACRRIAQRRLRVDRRTRCKRGHLLAGDNVRISRDGKRRCVICAEVQYRRR